LETIDCIAFGTHPDDAELFCSGLLIKLKKQGYSTAIIDLTRGELSTNGTPAVRHAETQVATEILKLDSRKNIGIPDGNIENNEKNRTLVIRHIRTEKPKVCLIPYWNDRHPDHVAASQLINKAIFQSGLKKIETNQKEYRPKIVLYYMLHNVFKPKFIIDISEEIENKMAAIKSYKSQFYVEEDKESTYINNPDFIESIYVRSQFYGRQIGCKFGEPYYFDGMLKIDNIMQFFT